MSTTQSGSLRQTTREIPAFRNILVVDGASAVRQQARQILESNGFRVVEASSGLEALQVAQSEHLDLIILDVNMPVMNGFVMLARLRKLPDYRQTPIFVLTNDSSGEVILQGKAAGVTAWMIKPLRSDVLIPAVRRAFKR
jgi:two-component system chemotaxis response regulator CheY